MHFTQVSILAILFLTPFTLCAPSLCKGPGGSGLTDCLIPDSQYCNGVWNRNVGGDSTEIQQWSMGANNVNEWDQHKFSQQLIKRACAPVGMKSSYDPNTLIAAVSWVSSSTCTAGRVTAAFTNSAGLRRVDCAMGMYPSGVSVGDGLNAGLRGALGALGALGGL